MDSINFYHKVQENIRTTKRRKLHSTLHQQSKNEYGSSTTSQHDSLKEASQDVQNSAARSVYVSPQSTQLVTNNIVNNIDRLTSSEPDLRFDYKPDERRPAESSKNTTHEEQPISLSLNDILPIGESHESVVEHSAMATIARDASLPLNPTATNSLNTHLQLSQPPDMHLTSVGPCEACTFKDG